MSLRASIGPPRLRSREAGERHATWSEGFFDLVFAVALSLLADNLVEQRSIGGFATFAILAAPVTWTWFAFTSWANRFDTDDPFSRLAIFAAALVSAAIAVNVGDEVSHGDAALAVSFAAARLLLLALWLRVRRHIPEARAPADSLMAVLAVTSGLWLVGIVLPRPLGFVAWGLAILVELSTTLWNARRMNALGWHRGHLPERFGLFALVMFGETVGAAAIGSTDTPWTVRSAAIGVFAFAGMVLLCWIYFDHVDRERLLDRRAALVYGHVLLAIGLAAAGAGTELAIIEADQSALSRHARWALASGVALAVLAYAFMSARPRAPGLPATRLTARRGRVAAGVAVLAIALVGGALPPWLFVLAIALVLGAALAVEIRSNPAPAADSMQRYVAPVGATPDSAAEREPESD